MNLRKTYSLTVRNILSPFVKCLTTKKPMVNMYIKTVQLTN